jgi:hypothetical protein
MRLKYKIKRTFLVKNLLISDQSVLPSKTYVFRPVTNTLFSESRSHVTVTLLLRAWSSERVPPFFRTFTCSKLKIWRFNFLSFGLIFRPTGWGGGDTHAFPCSVLTLSTTDIYFQLDQASSTTSQSFGK